MHRLWVVCFFFFLLDSSEIIFVMFACHTAVDCFWDKLCARNNMQDVNWGQTVAITGCFLKGSQTGFTVSWAHSLLADGSFSINWLRFSPREDKSSCIFSTQISVYLWSTEIHEPRWRLSCASCCPYVNKDSPLPEGAVVIIGKWKLCEKF